MNFLIRILFFTSLLLVATNPASCDQPVPELTGRVVDLTKTLSSDQKRYLSEQLAALEQSKGAQMAILLVPTTKSETIEQYSARVYDSWKLGRKGIGDGVLLTVAKADRTLRIEVGRGLEGAIPDAIASRVINETIVPVFKQGDLYGGLFIGTRVISRLIEGEQLPAPSKRSISGGNFDAGNLGGVFFVAVIIGNFLRLAFGRLLAALLVFTGVTLFFWLTIGSILLGIVIGLFVAMFTLVAGVRSPGYRSHRGWGGSGGGGSWGGGFRGGGGGFAGGGASGRW